MKKVFKYLLMMSVIITSSVFLNQIPAGAATNEFIYLFPSNSVNECANIYMSGSSGKSISIESFDATKFSTIQHEHLTYTGASKLDMSLVKDSDNSSIELLSAEPATAKTFSISELTGDYHIEYHVNTSSTIKISIPKAVGTNLDMYNADWDKQFNKLTTETKLFTTATSQNTTSKALDLNNAKTLDFVLYNVTGSHAVMNAWIEDGSGNIVAEQMNIDMAKSAAQTISFDLSGLTLGTKNYYVRVTANSGGSHQLSQITVRRKSAPSISGITVSPNPFEKTSSTQVTVNATNAVRYEYYIGGTLYAQSESSTKSLVNSETGYMDYDLNGKELYVIAYSDDNLSARSESVILRATGSSYGPTINGKLTAVNARQKKRFYPVILIRLNCQSA